MREALDTSSPSTCCASLSCKSWRPSCASMHVPPLTWSYPTQQVLIHSFAHCTGYAWHSLELQHHAAFHCEAYIPCSLPISLWQMGHAKFGHLRLCVHFLTRQSEYFDSDVWVKAMSGRTTLISLPPRPHSSAVHLIFVLIKNSSAKRKNVSASLPDFA